MRLLVFLLVAAFALAGCNANQPVSPSVTAYGTPPGPDPDPIHDAQTKGFYAGR